MQFGRRLAIAHVLAILAAFPAAAQDKPASKQKLAEIRKTVQALDWQKADFAGLSPLERCRSLMLLNHALDEIDDAAVAEADLAGTFVEQQKLSDAYDASSASETPVARSYEDARKIAVALLKGPMSDSRYAKELADSDAAALAGYEKVYEASTRRRWESFASTSQTLRKLIAFLKESKKLHEYMTWATAETERRQAEFDKAASDKRAEKAAAEAEKKAARAAEADAAQEQKNRADSLPAQQAIYGTQEPTTVELDDDDWYPGWYNGLIDNARRRPNPHPVYRNSEYQSAARARVAQRQHSGGGRRGGGGRRR